MANGQPEAASWLLQDAAVPRWSLVLRALREASAISRDGWAARLGTSVSSVQRWEIGSGVPGTALERALLEQCMALGLFREYGDGLLAGQTLTPESVRQLLVEARLARHSERRVSPSERMSAARGPTAPNSVPVSSTSFVGRRRALNRVGQLLAGARVVTLTGPGGVGKTRLAMQLARTQLGNFLDGIYWIDLAVVHDRGLVASTTAGLLNVTWLANSRSALETIAAFLRDRHVLLVLDNCEHQLAGCTELIDAVMTAAPNVRVLTTSRVPFRIPEEIAYRVQPLALPEPATLEALTAPSLQRYAASRLFIERAKAARPAFVVRESDVPVVIEICRRLDGIPLAIELAAVHARMLSVGQIDERLRTSMALLEDNSHSSLGRHQTLRQTIDWSFDLLTELQQLLLCRLAVFDGDWSLEAAEAVCAGQDIEPSMVLALLSELVDRSLVVVVDAGTPLHYTMLQMIRQYLRERLLAAGADEVTGLSRRLASWCIALAERTEPEFFSNSRAEAVARFSLDRHNFRAAMHWLLEQQEAS